MAALLARAARANAHMRLQRDPHVRLRASSAHRGGFGSLPKCGTHAFIDFHSFSTRASTEAKATTLADAAESYGGALAEEASSTRKDIDAILESKLLYVEKLARRNEFDKMLGLLVERYRPLYESHPALKGVPCLLEEKYSGVQAVDVKKKKKNIKNWRVEMDAQFRPVCYNDPVTRRIELKIMKELLGKGRPDLVVDVFDHRKFIGTRVGSVVHEKSGYVADFTNIRKEFSRLAMRAFDELGDHPRVMSAYEDVVKAGQTPSVQMTRWYLDALSAMQCFDEVRQLYGNVKDRKWPVDAVFYRQMLRVAELERDNGLLAEVRRKMIAEKIPLYADGYLTAMRLLEDEMFSGEADGDSTSPVPTNYHDCIGRITANNQLVSPKVHVVSKQILSLLDEMIDVAKLEPRKRMFLIPPIKAAFFVADYDLVAKYVDQFELTFDEPVEGEILLFAVLSSLLRDEPAAAWELVIKAFEAVSSDQNEHHSVSNKTLGALTSILQYLGTRQDLQLTRQFLDALKAKALLSQFKREQHASLIEAVVPDKTLVSDSTILHMLDEYADAFRITDKETSLEAFADACMASGRWSLLGQVLKTRNLKRIPWIADSLAVRISEAALEDKSSCDSMELVAEMGRVVNLTSLSDTDRRTLSANAAEAAEALRALPEAMRRPSYL